MENNKGKEWLENNSKRSALTKWVDNSGIHWNRNNYDRNRHQELNLDTLN